MKLELNVKRFNNEDVIATSGVCQHINANEHIHVNTYNAGNGTEDYAKYSYNAITGKLSLTGVQTMNLDGDGVTSTGWYYSDGAHYVKCEDQSGEAHPY